MTEPKRRTWDLDEYRKKARDREENENIVTVDISAVDLKPLVAREGDVDLVKDLGRTRVVSASGAATGDEASGFFCEACNCVIKDSMSYLDHLNGRKHQRRMGMSLKTKRSTLSDVKNRLRQHKRKVDEISKYSFDDRIQQLEEEEERKKRARKERRQEIIRRKELEKKIAEEESKKKDPEQEKEDEELAMMGLPTGFGTSKK
mmetsp:Transcript_245/g.258  ORF Transcript_245/g.258 Transcript_245/m.258 type:complete len:203 (+) Transcript_245:355-963(+)|eukprot:CAMPEP_0168537406 /NCGR_PEP_ID=MMETSP0405-20121227/20311_1 /TAXON_ID=498012 /ORGANISM="Trichosphaerium sp, Strain Am-I-7 wt" /LENGTH=202 /DNA_ID=CAMNT_0008565967 /DNA_START=24 /DNA_END=632 /DNA_ORIENTATION=-